MASKVTKDRRISVVFNDLVASNMDAVTEKYRISQSEVVRRALWLLFDAYLEPSEQHRQESQYVIGAVVENILKERGLI